MNIFYYITPFSQEIINIVVSYLSKHDQQCLKNKIPFLNKYFYSLIPGIEKISKYNFDKYIRWILRNDYIFLFHFCIEKIKNNNKKITYNNRKFNNYLEYVKYLIIIYDSGKCKSITWNVKST